jgi:4-amino-4-deoxy-L-arabinose transferase-like glycosyltransferase
MNDRFNQVARRVSITTLWVLLGPMVLWLTVKTQYTGLVHSDAMDYAQLARNVIEGSGFTTDVLRPLSLALHPGSGGEQPIDAHPDLTHPPLYAFVLALLFGALGARDDTVVLASCLFYLLTIPALYWLGIRWFNRTVATVGVLLFVLWRQTAGHAISGLPVTLMTLLMTLLLVALHRAAEPDAGRRVPDGRRLFGAGLVLGLCYLTEYAAVLFLIPIGIWLVMTNDQRPTTNADPGDARWGRRVSLSHALVVGRWSLVASFLAGFLILAGPWMFRNARLGVNPVVGLRSYELRMGTNAHPGYSLYRAADRSAVAPLDMGMAAQIAKKGVLGAGVLYDQLPQLPGVWLTPFLVLSAFYRFRRPGVDALRWCGLGMLATFAVVSVFTRATIEVESYVPFVPLFLVLGVAALVRLMADQKLKPAASRAVLTALVLVTVFPLATSLKFSVPVRSGIDTAGLGRLPSVPGGVIASDVPWAVAWYGNRAALWLPQTEKDLERLAPRFGGLYLTGLLLSYPETEEVERWKAFYSASWTRVGLDEARRLVVDPTPVYFGVHGVLGQEAGKPRFQVRQVWNSRAILLQRVGDRVACSSWRRSLRSRLLALGSDP